MFHRSVWFWIPFKLIINLSLNFAQETDEDCPYLEAQNSLLSVITGDYRGMEQPDAPVMVNLSFLIRDVSDINEMKRYAAFLLSLTMVRF